MSFEAMAWAIKQRTGSPTAKLVLLCLANYSDEHNQTFTSQKRLAEQAEVSIRTVRDMIKLLESKSLIGRKHRHRADGTRTSDLFTLPISYPAESASSSKASGNLRHTNRQNLPGKRDEPITEPITKEIDEVRKKKLEALKEKLQVVITEASAPRRRVPQRATA